MLFKVITYFFLFIIVFIMVIGFIFTFDVVILIVGILSFIVVVGQYLEEKRNE